MRYMPRRSGDMGARKIHAILVTGAVTLLSLLVRETTAMSLRSCVSADMKYVFTCESEIYEGLEHMRWINASENILVSYNVTHLNDAHASNLTSTFHKTDKRMKSTIVIADDSQISCEIVYRKELSKPIVRITNRPGPKDRKRIDPCDLSIVESAWFLLMATIAVYISISGSIVLTNRY